MVHMEMLSAAAALIDQIDDKLFIQWEVNFVSGKRQCAVATESPTRKNAATLHAKLLRSIL